MKGRAFTIGGLLAVLVSLLSLVSLPQAALAGYDVWTTRSLLGYQVQTLAIDPQASHLLYAGANQGLLFSPDGGSQWSVIATPFTNVQTIVLDPQTPSTLYTVADNQLYKSVDGGGTWAALGTGVLDGPQFLVLDPQLPDNVYVGTRSGGFHSSDGGTTWAGLGIPVAGAISAAAVDPRDSSIVYAVNEREGFFKSTDGAQSWTLTGAGFPQGWEMNALLFDSSDSRTLYACSYYGYYGGFYKSSDAGSNWVQVRIEGAGDVTALAPDPHHGGRVYAAGNYGGIFRSDDGGASWSQTGQGLPERSRVTKLIFDPQVADVQYAIVNGQLHKSFDGGSSWVAPQYTGGLGSVLAHPDQQAKLYAAVYQAGIYVSTNLGETWEARGAGLPERIVIGALALDPQNPQTLYAGTAQGLYRSTDDGASWQLTGLPTNVSVRTVAVDPQDNNRLFVGGQQGILVSTNGGSSWTAVALPQEGAVNALAIDPQNPAQVYAGADRGLFTSTDGGQTWAGSTELLRQRVWAITLDPESPSTIYVGTDQGVYWRSDGESPWTTRSGGLPQGTWARSLAVDPQTADVLYVGTSKGVYISPNKGGVWYAINDGLGLRNVGMVTTIATEPTTLLALAAEQQYGSGSSLWYYSVSTVPMPTPTPTPLPTFTPGPTRTPWPTRTPQPTVTRSLAAAPTRSGPEATATARARAEIQPTDSAGGPAVEPEEEKGGFPWLPVLGGLVILLVLASLIVWIARSRQAKPKTVRCPKCRTENAPGNRFCIKCGNRLS